MVHTGSVHWDCFSDVLMFTRKGNADVVVFIGKWCSLGNCVHCEIVFTGNEMVHLGEEDQKHSAFPTSQPHVHSLSELTSAYLTTWGLNQVDVNSLRLFGLVY